MLLDRFELLEEVGRGASGVVYRARDRASGHLVAVKLLRDEGRRADTLPLRVRLRREAALLGRVKHPGVVTVIDAASEREVPYLITEYVDGVSLEQLLRERGPLPPAEIVSLVVQAAQALHAAHAQGVVHRDVKPANLLVTAGGSLKITDFGVAGETGDEARRDLENDRYVWGTPAYIPPERWRGSPLDGRGDLYSLAVVLYLGLSGRHPFEERSTRELKHRILHDEPPAVSSLRPGLPLALDEFLRRALAKNPAQRFNDGDAFARALEAIAIPPMRESWRPADRGWGLVDDASAQTRRVPREHRQAWRRAGGAASAFTVVALLSWLAVAWRPTEVVTEPGFAAIATAALVPPAMALEIETPPAPPSPPVAAEATPPAPAEPRARPTTIRAPERPSRPPLILARDSRPARPMLQPVSSVSHDIPRSRGLVSGPALSARAASPLLEPPGLAPGASAPPLDLSNRAPSVPPEAPLDLPALAAAPVPSVAPERAPAAPSSARGVVEIIHPLDEGLMEVRVAGRRVALVRVTEGVPAIASFRVPLGDQHVSISLMSATRRVEVQQRWDDHWDADRFRSRRWTLLGPDPEWRLEERP